MAKKSNSAVSNLSNNGKSKSSTSAQSRLTGAVRKPGVSTSDTKKAANKKLAQDQGPIEVDEDVRALIGIEHEGVAEPFELHF